jgi:hypothetical protein
MSTIPSQTTGLGVAAKIAVAGNQGTSTTPGYNPVILSVSATGYASTFQLNPDIQDAAGNHYTAGTAFTLTSVASSSGNTAVYTGTITGGGSNAFAGYTFVVAGFVTHTSNNGEFICTASGTTTLTLENASAVSETHAATATSEEITAGNQLTYVAYPVKTLTGNTYQPSGTSSAVATVSATGLITAVKPGNVEVEVSFPTFNNTSGTTGNTFAGTLPLNKIYASVNVQIVP